MGRFACEEEAASAEITEKERRRIIRTLVVDAEPFVRAGLRAEFADEPNIEVAAEAQDGLQAVELARGLEPEIIFMGVSLPLLNGLQATKRIVKTCIRSRVVIFSRHDEPEYIRAALRSGAGGYLLKRADLEELHQAIRTVNEGGIYLSRQISDEFLRDAVCRPTVNGASVLDQLTDRQCEILQMVAEGRNSKEIAQVLGVSRKTVDFHVNKLRERLDIRDVPGMVRLAWRELLIERA